MLSKKNLSKRFGKMSLGKRNEKLFDIFPQFYKLTLSVSSFMKNLLMTKSKDLKCL